MPERILWNLLRAGRMGELKFRRQQPIGPHVVDFFCERARFVVELDGASHLEASQFAADRVRDAFLSSKGLRVLRILNDDVLTDRFTVSETIRLAAEDHTPPREPNPCIRR